MLIADVLDGAKILLFPRPRRFGKTMNMSMLQCFLEKHPDDTTDVFADTAIWHSASGRYRDHFRQYPVIFLTMKEMRHKDWDAAWWNLRVILQAELRRLEEVGHIRAETCPNPELLKSISLDAARPAYAESMLAVILEWVKKTTGQQAVLLIDEYDAPLHAAAQYGYWDEAIHFFRNFLSAGLKDSPHLFRGVLTGILRVAKENIFSGLNNIQVRSVLDPRSADRFGFLEDDVIELANRAGLSDKIDEFRRWYNGYEFGGLDPVTVYNPWSIVNRCANPKGGFQSYWLNSSNNELARDMLTRTAGTNGPDLERLVRGEPVMKMLNDAVPLQELTQEDSTLWPLLVSTGYLTTQGVTLTDDGLVGTLRIPNQEVSSIFRATFLRLVGDRSDVGGPTELAKALLKGDAAGFGRLLGEIMRTALSYHDTARHEGRNIEAIYQAFIIGLLVHLAPTHRVVSNRESGYGRADVLITPKGPGPGVVLELKVIDHDLEETAETALESALDQLRTRDYAAELRAADASPIHQMGVVFDGKRCWVAAV
jgi:hypothetical protein